MSQTLSEKEERAWAMWCHLSALIGYFLIPFGNVLGPLIIWLIKKDDSNFIDQQGKESLNFQITITVYMIVSIILMVILIGFVLAAVLYVGALVFMIIASIKANEGKEYRYPLTIRFIG
ncbi:DUF4870 domain-containing protein [Mechercharimyces sp. CAU 1602]|uniref:DUF4870 domain-containing protein n=1 Tax=Mechercharimyces sp. CAU 1602 TaxID=2973933 RepID=UPI0021639ADF|nr:DUF4870 domain-containing protein [Mechercharimyces sp. CAU 1602]MCS1351732.1 DUF4870 domain-containing protein [Mechercharimyces sp. CAU 1602]